MAARLPVHPSRTRAASSRQRARAAATRERPPGPIPGGLRRALAPSGLRSAGVLRLPIQAGTERAAMGTRRAAPARRRGPTPASALPGRRAELPAPVRPRARVPDRCWEKKTAARALKAIPAGPVRRPASWHSAGMTRPRAPQPAVGPSRWRACAPSSGARPSSAGRSGRPGRDTSRQGEAIRDRRSCLQAMTARGGHRAAAAGVVLASGARRLLATAPRLPSSPVRGSDHSGDLGAAEVPCGSQ